MKGKNLFDVGKMMDGVLFDIKHDNNITGIALNQNTLAHMNKYGLHGFEIDGKQLIIHVDNSLPNGVAKYIHKEQAQSVKVEAKPFNKSIWDDEKAEEIRQRFFEMHKKFNEMPFDELGQMDTKTTTGIDPDEFKKLTIKHTESPSYYSLQMMLYNLMEENNKLREENKYLKMSCPEQNIEHFRIIGENKRKIDNLRYANKNLRQNLNTARHRLNIANEYIETRKENMIPEHYDDLKYIINECDLESSW